MFRVFGTPDETAYVTIQSITDEGIGAFAADPAAKVTYTEFKCPWGYCSSKSQQFRGLIVVTSRRVLLHNYHRRLLDVAAERLHSLELKANDDQLVVEFVASFLNSKYSGRVAIAFCSQQAQEIEAAIWELAANS